MPLQRACWPGSRRACHKPETELTNTCTSITTFSLSHGVCGKASLRSCSPDYRKQRERSHARRESSPLGTTDESACVVKAA